MIDGCIICYRVYSLALLQMRIFQKLQVPLGHFHILDIRDKLYLKKDLITIFTFYNSDNSSIALLEAGAI